MAFSCDIMAAHYRSRAKPASPARLRRATVCRRPISRRRRVAHRPVAMDALALRDQTIAVRAEIQIYTPATATKMAVASHSRRRRTASMLSVGGQRRAHCRVTTNRRLTLAKPRHTHPTIFSLCAVSTLTENLRAAITEEPKITYKFMVKKSQTTIII